MLQAVTDTDPAYGMQSLSTIGVHVGEPFIERAF